MRYMIFFAICLFLSTACSISSPTITSFELTASPSVILTTPSIASSQAVDNLVKIDSGDISNLEWQTNPSLTLIYLSGSNYKKYDLATSTLNTVDLQLLNTSNCLTTDTICITPQSTPTIPFGLFDSNFVHRIDVSPSKNIVLYWVYIPDENYPTPEPTDENYPNPVDGPPPKDFYDIWIVTSNYPLQKIGTINGCWYEAILWTPDELKFVIPRVVGPYGCAERNNGWIGYVQEKKVLPISDKYGLVDINNLSPSGTKLLAGNLQNSLVIDLDTLEVKILDNFALDWITNNLLLSSYINESKAGLGLYDIDLNTFTTLTSMNNEKTYCLNEVIISPDKQWVAFSDQTECFRSKPELWILKIR